MFSFFKRYILCLPTKKKEATVPHKKHNNKYIHPSELKIETLYLDKNKSVVRVMYIPTGQFSEWSRGNSVFENRSKALENLENKINKKFII